MYFWSFVDDEKDMFAAQWFDKYNEKDGSVRERTRRRQSLVIVPFNDSDDEPTEPFDLHEELGTIQENWGIEINGNGSLFIVLQFTVLQGYIHVHVHCVIL